ncbi:MAG: DUF4097 domain-containing protein [Vicinamibacterales bacterium]
MSTGLMLAAMTALALTTATAQERKAPEAPGQEPIQARPGGPPGTPTTDQTVDVARGTRLVLSNSAGEVVVRAWDRDAVRVEATHTNRERIDIQPSENTLRVRTRSAGRGPAGLVDYRLTVPRWMAVNLSGTYLEAGIEGTTAEVAVETVHGNIRVNGGSGTVSLRSVEGTITVRKTTGRVQASTVNEGISLADIEGEVLADTINGDIDIENARATSLEVSTVNGDVTFNGSVGDQGTYRLTTHDGDIRVGLGGAANAIVFVRSFRGDFSADFPIELPDGQSTREGSKRFNFTLGNGSARIELQSFSGDIHVGRNRVRSKAEERQRRREERGRPGTAPAAPGDAWEADLDRTLEHALEHAFDHVDVSGHVDKAGIAVTIAPEAIGRAMEATAGLVGEIVGGVVDGVADGVLTDEDREALERDLERARQELADELGGIGITIRPHAAPKPPKPR